MGKSDSVKLSMSLLKKTTTDFLNRLAESVNKKEVSDVVEEMSSFLSTTEEVLDERGCGYETFSTVQQKLFLRIKNYSLPLYASLFPSNYQKIKEMLQESNFGSKIKDISFIPSSRTLWKLMPLKRNKFDMTISDLFLMVDDESLLGELIDHIDSKIGRRRKSKLPHPFKSKSCSAFAMSIERGVLHREKAGKGSFFDLNIIFDNLNATWFKSKLQSNGLYWTPRNSRKRTGYYKARSREIFITKNFDDPDVPAFVVEFVMYHEMLHMEQGDDLLHKGKRAHDVEFRRREKLHPKYSQADKFLHKFARG